MTRWSAITPTRARRSALAYGSRSTNKARKTTSTDSYTTSGDATDAGDGEGRGLRIASSCAQVLQQRPHAFFQRTWGTEAENENPKRKEHRMAAGRRSWLRWDRARGCPRDRWDRRGGRLEPLGSASSLRLSASSHSAALRGASGPEKLERDRRFRTDCTSRGLRAARSAPATIQCTSSCLPPTTTAHC